MVSRRGGLFSLVGKFFAQDVDSPSVDVTDAPLPALINNKMMSRPSRSVAQVDYSGLDEPGEERAEKK